MSENKASRFKFEEEIPIEVSIAGLKCITSFFDKAAKLGSQLIDVELAKVKAREAASQAEILREKSERSRKLS